LIAPLERAWFRSLLLIAAAIPIAVLYAWRTLVLPLASGALPEDFTVNYMAAAAKIASGHNPYDLSAATRLTVAGPQYVTPLPVAWMLQPLLHASATTQLIVVLAVLQLSVVVFLVTTLRALGVRGWQSTVLLVLVAIAFEPVAANIDEGQINLVLLALSGIWLLGWVQGDRWWAGVALGAGVAVKLLQAPLCLLVLWGRRWRMLAGAAVAGLALWLVAVPQYLPDFVLKVAPVLSAGTGLFENHSPGRLSPLNAGAVGPLLEHFVRASEDWRSYLNSKPDFNLPIRRRDGGSVPAWVVVMQAVHHGNDHRTHVGTALMNGKLPCPELGAWEYGYAIGALQILG